VFRNAGLSAGDEVTRKGLTDAGSSRLPLARGVWMTVSDAAIELRVPRLFADRPIVLPPEDVAVCRPEEISEPTDSEISSPPQRRIELVAVGKDRREANLVLALAQPTLFPPVRLRARFHPEGWVFHRARDTPHDGYMVYCPERDRAIALLTTHGVELTGAPYAWVATRRNWT
jgi:hypothetical protein